MFSSLCLPRSASAQPPILVVSRIVITNVGPPAASEGRARANIRVKEGDIYNSTSVDNDIQNLYATGYFHDIRVTEDRAGDQITLTYFLQGKPILTDLQIVGNRKFSVRKLKKGLTSKVGEPLDERKLFNDTQEIRKRYQKAGMPKTEVNYIPRVEAEVGRATVTFEIKESPKVKIEKVYFAGANGFSQNKLRKRIKTRRRWMFSWLTGSGLLKDEQLEDDKDRLADYYRGLGYIDFQLRDVNFLYRDPRHVILQFVVSEGSRYRVGAIDFKGVALFSTNEILSKLQMKVGEIFTPKGLTKDLEMIQDLYGTKGYIDARVIARRNANILTGTMDLVYELEERERSRIEKIEIKGNAKTKDRVIRRELAVWPGEVFDMVKVKLSKRRLEGLQFFDRVEAQPEPTEVPNRRNLVVSVNEKNTGNFTIGAGFSSVDSLVGFAEITQGNFDLFNPPWFTGGGQKFRLRTQIGLQRQDYVLTFIEPWLLGKKLQFSTELYHRELGYISLDDVYRQRLTGARFGLSKALGSDDLIGGITYTLENVGITDVQEDASPLIKIEEGDRLVSKVGVSLAYDTRNSTLLPDKGGKTEIRTELAGGPLGAETDFYKLELRSSRFIKGFAKGHVLELGGRIGVLDNWWSSHRVPLFDRWFLGGIYDLRGYRFREVGPKDNSTDEEPIGGNTYWYATAEYSLPIIERLRFAAFYDIGMVYRDTFSFSQQNFGTGHYNDNWGIGLRINLPIGPLRLDYGIPITTGRDNDSSGRFQFSVGYVRDF